MGRRAKPYILRVLESVDTTDSSRCWIWPKAVNGDGYAQMTLAGLGRYADGRKRVRTKKIAPMMWEWANKHHRPPGMHVDHACHSFSDCVGGKRCVHRRCVNPLHLELVSPKKNTLRSRAITALNKRKRFCPRGHPYDEVNTYQRPDGGRDCKRCRRERGQVRKGAAH